jgi:APA family basic amino acid/polyamine antiporter
MHVSLSHLSYTHTHTQKPTPTDGLLPAVFAKVDKKGNLFMGTLIAGVLGTVIALVLPFHKLEDMISAGVLIAFNFSNTGLMVFRRTHPTHPSANRWLVLVFNVFALLAAFSWANFSNVLSETDRHTHTQPTWHLPVSILLTLLALVPLVLLEITCPDQVSPSDGHFRTPFVPWVPALGAAFNWFLLAQLTWEGLGLVCVYLLVAVCVYGGYGYWRSKGARDG